MRHAPWLLALAFLSACATLHPQTGDVSFRLLWSGNADLDLHVVDPGAGHVGLPFLAAAAGDKERYAALTAQMEATGHGPDGKTAGVLDIDCNADVSRLCREPMENIYWATGQAPHGDYQVWVELFNPHEKQAAVPYVLEIRRGESVVRRLSGTVSAERRKSEVAACTY